MLVVHDEDKGDDSDRDTRFDTLESLMSLLLDGIWDYELETLFLSLNDDYHEEFIL